MPLGDGLLSALVSCDNESAACAAAVLGVEQASFFWSDESNIPSHILNKQGTLDSWTVSGSANATAMFAGEELTRNSIDWRGGTGY